MTEAWGYTRLSQTSDTSIDRQKRHIVSYTDEHGFTLAGILDDGERSSGFDAAREKYQELRKLVSDGDLDAIVVNDKKRLARDFDETMRLILDCREQDVEIHTHRDGQLDISDPMNASIEVLRAASDHEAKLEEIEKAKEAVRERVDNGCYHGTPPFGLRFAEDKCHLEKAEEQFDQLETILERREDGDRVVDVAEDVGVSTATVSRATSRGIEWYEEKLAEYGLDAQSDPKRQTETPG